MTDPKAATLHPFALVADPKRDPGSCAVYRLLYPHPGGWLGLRQDRDPKDDPAPIPTALIVTRSNDLNQIAALKTMLDKAWADSGEGLRKAQADAARIVIEHGRTVDVTSSEALKAFGIRAVVDVESATNAMIDNARQKRIALWTYVVERLSTVPLLPENVWLEIVDRRQ